MITFVLLAHNEVNDPYVSLGSLLCQTNPNWKAIVFHNGINYDMHRMIVSLHDRRITYVETHANNGTDTINRETAFRQLVNTEWVVSSSIQDYFLPKTVESILSVADKSDFIHWNGINHLYHDNHIHNTKPEPTFIDWSNMAIRTELAKQINLVHRFHQADGQFALSVMETNPRVVKIDKCLVVHN